MACIVEEVDELAVSPDTALLDCGVVHAALAPDALQLLGIQGAAVGDLEKSATFRAVIQDVRNGV